MRADLLAIVRAALERVDPAQLLSRALARNDRDDHFAPARVLSVGKAAEAMAIAAAKALGWRIVDGLVISPGVAVIPPLFRAMKGSHPLPTDASEAAGRAALSLAAATAPDETFFCLLSGGASALMAVPADGITLADKIETTSRLMHASADIVALNTVRKHISAIKGGQLARASRGRSRTLAISDVVGDDLTVIGSGPGVPDNTTFTEALHLLDRFGGRAAYPAAVVAHLERGARGQVAETLKTSEASGISAAVIGGRREAMDGACDAAAQLGYQVWRIEEAIVGEAREAARRYVDRVATLTRSANGLFCVVSSGETTVRVKGTGKGGRNQEFALAAAQHLGTIAQEVHLASLGTDGIDGPTPAAGAIVDQSSDERARAHGMNADAFLADNNSYPFFQTLGDLIEIGPTGTNVSDLQVLVGRRT